MLTRRALPIQTSISAAGGFAGNWRVKCKRCSVREVGFINSFSICAAVVIFTAAESAHDATSKTSGIYLTATDFTGGRLTSEGQCGSKAHRIQLHDVLGKPYIDVKHGMVKRRYAKSALFGFRACDGKDYRFALNLEYRILETRDLYIYSRETETGSGKARHAVDEFSFSAGRDADILRLTLDNLKHAFPDNHKFHDSLDQMFGSGQDLAQYDEFHKMFKANRLLVASRTP